MTTNKKATVTTEADHAIKEHPHLSQRSTDGRDVVVYAQLSRSTAVPGAMHAEKTIFVGPKFPGLSMKWDGSVLYVSTRQGEIEIPASNVDAVKLA